MTVVRIGRDRLVGSDLLVDAIYEGGRSGHAGDDPLGPLLGVSNQGGFRILGSYDEPHLMVITTSMTEADWPDFLDLGTGLFTYYGDNRKPGLDLHDTPRQGNRMLRDLFSRVHSIPQSRNTVAPVLIFRTAGTYRDVRFLGLAVPGAASLPSTEDLVAIWRHTSGQRFQNYRAVFSVLNVATVSRAWIEDIRRASPNSEAAPAVWRSWVKGGQPAVLRSAASIEYRNRGQQLTQDGDGGSMLAAIRKHFAPRPHEFEACAAAIAEMLLPGIVSLDLTRLSRDGGRDAVGNYRIGSETTSIDVEFALEAKCYGPTKSVGVKDTSRLISRLRHRQFGILVTTSYVNTAAQREILEDGHPVLLVSGGDIIGILRQAGMRDRIAVEAWLEANFSSPAIRLDGRLA